MLCLIETRPAGASEKALSCCPVPSWSPHTPAFLLHGELDPSGNFSDKAIVLQANDGKPAHGADLSPFMGNGLCEENVSTCTKRKQRFMPAHRYTCCLLVAGIHTLPCLHTHTFSASSSTHSTCGLDCTFIFLRQ